MNLNLIILFHTSMIHVRVSIFEVTTFHQMKQKLDLKVHYNKYFANKHLKKCQLIVAGNRKYAFHLVLNQPSHETFFT